MNYRNATLLSTVSIATAGVKMIDLDLKNIISRITILVEVLNANYVPTNHPLAVLKKIEIVDGSEVLFSLSGYEAQALSYYNNGFIDHNELNYENKATCRASVTINFGRWLYDELFALDPTKYRNLQLRIDHNVGLGGCLPTAGNLRVYADLFDEKVVTPTGFFGAKEIFSYLATGGHAEYIILPTDDVLRMLMVINTCDHQEPDVMFETIKIDEDDGSRVIFDGYTMDLIRMAASRYGRFTEYLSGRVGTSGEEFYLSACKDIMLGINGASSVQSYFHGVWSGGRQRDIRGSADADFGGNCSGRCPHGAVPIFLGKQNDPDDWWDVSRVGKARAILTSRASIYYTDTTAPSSNNNLVVQTAVKY